MDGHFLINISSDTCGFKKKYKTCPNWKKKVDKKIEYNIWW